MRELSQTAIEAVYQEHSGEIFLFCLTIEEDSLSEPIRVVNNTESITSNGYTFTPFPFEVILPMDDGKSLPSLKLAIDNVSQEMIRIIRALVTPPMVTLQLILVSDPDTIELEVSNMAVREITANETTITFSIVNDDWLSSSWPAHKYNITGYRGLFR